MNAPIITAAFLRSVLHYDPLTGEFTWRERTDVRPQWNARYAGKTAGYQWCPSGSRVTYRSIRILDWPFMGHRLAWLYMTGEWPANDVDHRDGDGLNNRWANLRAATKTQNGANRGPTKRNKTGFKGVSRLPDGRYRATIQIDGRWRQIGVFATAEEAGIAYAVAAKEGAGEYARTAP